MAKLLLGRVFAPADPHQTFEGKTVLVTGSNTGLGFEAAAKFVEKGASKVILAVRTLTKGEAAKKAIAKRYGHEDNMEVLELDMNSYDSIVSAVTWINNNVASLDIAVLNAGVYKTEYTASKYSFEETLQVNTISTTLLAILLLPKLKKSSFSSSSPSSPSATNPAVLEFVSSGNHARVNTSEFKHGNNVLNAHNDTTKFNPGLNYGVSKLLLMFVMQQLSDIVLSSSTLIDSVCPGLCRSDLSREYDGFLMKNLLKPLIFPIMRTSEQGARTLVSGTVLEGGRAHGRFWQHDQIQDKIAILSGDDGKKLQGQIWNEVVDAIRKDYPNVDDAIEQIRS